jgi:Uma2 family endonuclease
MATQVASQAAPVYRLSVQDVLAMVVAGILDEDKRLELVDGVLVEMSWTGPRHAGVVEWLITHIAPALGGALRLRVQDTFLISEHGFVVPDLMVIEPIGRDRLPDRALLIVEVANTSHRRDAEKAATYARAEVPDYWIVDVVRNELLVHRAPAGDAYADVTRFVAGDVVSPLVDVAPVDVAALLAP